MLTPDHTFVLLAEGRGKPGQWSSTGVILSVKDLLEAEAVVQPIVYITFGLTEAQRSLAQEKWGGITMKSLEMNTGDGRRWAFDTKKRCKRCDLRDPRYLWDGLEGRCNSRLFWLDWFDGFNQIDKEVATF